MASDGQIIGAAAKWTDQGVLLKELIDEPGTELPTIVKIVKGQYGGFGVPSLPNPGLQSTALLVSCGKRVKIMAQVTKSKDGRSSSSHGQKLFIPDAYDGFFELLSEDGKSARCLESVYEVVKRWPESGFLVREPLRVLSACVKDGSQRISADGARMLSPGELLYPVRETHFSGNKSRFLLCSDSNEKLLLLAFDQKGKFSVLAKEESISGVHTIKNLLTKRMPVTVRLVHGHLPVGLKVSHNFQPEFRLLFVIEEDNLFALPLQKESSGVTNIPVTASLRVQTSKNFELVKAFPQFASLVSKAKELIKPVQNLPHVVEHKIGIFKLVRGNTPSTHKVGFMKRSTPELVVMPASSKEQENRMPPVCKEDYDDIDQIYDYVRGMAPLPKNLRAPCPDGCSPKQLKPPPPPIETIPTRKLVTPLAPMKAEKRTRKATVHSKSKDTKVPGSVFVKNSSPQRIRVLRHKVSGVGGAKGCIPTIGGLGKNVSPVMGVRYKSLSDLQGMDMDGTLDSSHSGGRASGDSATGVKLPEKRSRRLSRPLSLSNLVWEMKRCDAELPVPVLHGKKLHPTPHKRIGTLYL